MMTLAEFLLTSLPVTVSRPLGRNNFAYLLTSFRCVPYGSLVDEQQVRRRCEDLGAMRLQDTRRPSARLPPVRRTAPDLGEDPDVRYGFGCPRRTESPPTRGESTIVGVPVVTITACVQAKNALRDPLPTKPANDRQTHEAQLVLDVVCTRSSRHSRPATVIAGAIHVMGTPSDIQIRALHP